MVSIILFGIVGFIFIALIAEGRWDMWAIISQKKDERKDIYFRTVNCHNQNNMEILAKIFNKIEFYISHSRCKSSRSHLS